MPSTVITPNIVEIPLRLIHSNPDNPRPFIPEEAVGELAANIQEVGLNNPIKVMVDKSRPEGETHYVNLSGEIRYRAFVKLGRETIPAQILDLNPEEAATLTYLENRSQDMGWWGDYRAVENLKKANPDLSQRQVATKLNMDLPKVNRALALLPLLDSPSRAILVSDANTQNKGKKGISELAVAELAGLTTTPITPGTQELVRRALKVAIDQWMTQAEVKQLVEWVKGGNQPESYWVTQSTKTPKGLKKPGARPASSPRRGAKGSKGTSGVVQGVLTGLGHQAVQHLKTQVGNKLRKWFVWAVVCGAVALVLNYILPPLVTTYLAKRFNQYLPVGPGTQPDPTLKKGDRGGFEEKPSLVSPSRQTGKPRVSTSKPHTQVVSQPLPLTKGDREGIVEGQAQKGPVHLPTGPQAGGQAMVVPTSGLRSQTEARGLNVPIPEKEGIGDRGAEGNGGTKVGSVPLWATADSNYVSDFAAHFFRISYVNWPSTLDYFKTRLDKDYFPVFQNQYFPSTLKGQMEEKRLVQTFWSTGAPKLLGWEGESDEYLVKGTHSLENHYNEPAQTLSKETAGVVVQVVHDIDTGKRVVKATLATPEQLAAASQPADTKKDGDLGKQIGDGVNDLKDAVNKADDGKSALDKARGLIGF